jgi:hypothetical protein
LADGDFATASQAPGWPQAWDRGAEGQISWEAANGIHFVHLVSMQPGQLVQVSQTAPIPPGLKGLNESARFRTSGVKFGKSFQNDARMLFQFLDAQGKPVKPGPPNQIFDSHAADWTEAGKGFLVPGGATRIKVILCLNRPASGTLDVSEVKLTSMSAADVQAIVMAPILMAKKKVDDEAEVQRMLNLPPKTAGIKVSGNKLVTADGTPVWLQGVNVCSLEWSPKGENVEQSVKVSIEDWKANAIRLPVYDGFWFGQGKPPQVRGNDAQAYRQIVDSVVRMAAGQGAYVILDLHRFHAPQERDTAFWKDAAARYKNNPAVLFDIFNEPGGITWQEWRDGGTIQDKAKKGAPLPPPFQSPGMQGLVNTVRSVGANNVIIAGGLGSAYDLMGVLQGFALEDKTGNGIMYATHFYNWHRNWDKHFLPLADKYPLFVGETGADIRKMPFVSAKDQENPYTWAPDALGMIQKYKLNWTAFCMHPKSAPILISDWNYDPTPFWGVFVKEALAGKQFELEKMR